MAAANRLYVVPASHPCATAMKALELKGIEYKRIDLVPLVHVAVQSVVFGARTVPGLIFDDGQKVQGSRAIVRAAERRVAEPALLPGDPEARRAVETAEDWGDEVLQPLVRRLIWQALKRSPDSVPSYSEGASLPVPAPLARASAPAVAFGETLLNRASDANARADLTALPGHLDRIDGWIEAGVLGAGGVPNAADLQIGSGLRLLLTIGDLDPLIGPRPAGALARGVFGAYPGHVPAGTLPAAWLP